MSSSSSSPLASVISCPSSADKAAHGCCFLSSGVPSVRPLYCFWVFSSKFWNLLVQVSLFFFFRGFLLVTFIFFCFDYLALDICSSRFLRLSSHLFDRFIILRALHRFRHFLLQLLPFSSHFFILFKENSSNNKVFSSKSIVGGGYPQRNTSDWAGVVVLCGLEDGRPWWRAPARSRSQSHHACPTLSADPLPP